MELIMDISPANAIDVIMVTRMRSDRLKPIMEEVKRSIKTPFNMFYVIESFDTESERVINEIIAENPSIYIRLISGDFGCYSRGFNYAYLLGSSSIFITFNDDIQYLTPWVDNSVAMLNNLPAIHIIGTPVDDYPFPWATILTFRRDYIRKFSGVMDMPNTPLYPYHHYCVDNELYYTAIYRGIYKVNPITTNVRSAAYLKDSTMEFANQFNDEDVKLYNSRKHMFDGKIGDIRA